MKRVAIIGGGPAGLMAAEVLAGCAGAGRLQVDVFDAMPSVGRKFLLAGKGGLNLTHSEPLQPFLERYGARRPQIEPLLKRFGPDELRAWAHGLGVETFVGSSGRVFPRDMKAAPLLRAWLHRLRMAGVRFHMRHRWMGLGDATTVAGPLDAIAPPALRFATPQGAQTVHADAVVLALGGGSWARLGSDGAWVPWLQAQGVDVAPLQPSNCGFEVARPDASGQLTPGWTDHFSSRFAGTPLKNVALSCERVQGPPFSQPGECVVTQAGLEGSLVYAASGAIRDTIGLRGRAVVHIDLLPMRSAEWVHAEVAHPRGSRSLSTHLKTRLGLEGVKASLLHELLPRETMADPSQLASAIKALPVVLTVPRPIDEAISTAGGVRFEALDEDGMLRAMPGVFCAGEMLDWEAPTGGYLLTACFASGVSVAEGVARFLKADGPAASAT
jgi:uncharacterized flavoprotein (TIGR03862 family)